MVKEEKKKTSLANASSTNSQGYIPQPGFCIDSDLCLAPKVEHPGPLPETSYE